MAKSNKTTTDPALSKQPAASAAQQDLMIEDADPVQLPENAFRELGADEQYRPMMHPARDYREVTPLLRYNGSDPVRDFLGSRRLPRTESGPGV